MDRCHRFDFQRPTVEQLAVVVRPAAPAEGLEIPPEAVAAVARSATGSFRDALGTLEQLLTYSGLQPALEDVLAVLGVTDSQLLEETVDAVDRGDARAALTAVARCTESGRDAGAFAADLGGPRTRAARGRHARGGARGAGADRRGGRASGRPGAAGRAGDGCAPA